MSTVSVAYEYSACCVCCTVPVDLLCEELARLDVDTVEVLVDRIQVHKVKRVSQSKIGNVWI
jgi:hypothetical protein